MIELCILFIGMTIIAYIVLYHHINLKIWKKLTRDNIVLKRIKAEQKELGIKIARLYSFFEDAKFPYLTETHKSLLKDQYNIMNSYYLILQTRISLMETRE